MSPQAPVREHKVSGSHKHRHIVSNYIYGFFLIRAQFIIATLPPYPQWNSALITKFPLVSSSCTQMLVIQVAKRMQIGCNRISQNTLGIPLKKGFHGDSGLNKSLLTFFKQ